MTDNEVNAYEAIHAATEAVDECDYSDENYLAWLLLDAAKTFFTDFESGADRRSALESALYDVAWQIAWDYNITVE